MKLCLYIFILILLQFQSKSISQTFTGNLPDKIDILIDYTLDELLARIS